MVILKTGETQQISATITPSDATRGVVWTITEISGYAISFYNGNNGQIKASNRGVARLTASTEDGSIEAHCYVGVFSQNETITLNKSSTRLTVGQSDQLYILPEYLEANIPDFNVTWTSSNTNVAIVENGTVTAVSEGTATISANIENTNFKPNCTVAVEAPQDNTTDFGVEINGVFWATRNVDMPGTFAAFPERPGMFYQWNKNIPWSTTDPLPDVPVPDWDTSVPEVALWEPETDPSPEGWRLPTAAERSSLSDESKVSRTWTTLNGVDGYRFTDRQNGNSIFLPAVGMRDENDGSLQDEQGSSFASGNYWSGQGTPTTINNGLNSFFWTFSATSDLWCSNRRPAALSVRSVKIQPVLPNGCNTAMPEWGGSLGTVSFATNQEWIVGNKIWSDAVQTSICSGRSPSEFETGNSTNGCANCRSNPGQKGDFFSWCAVQRYAETLCPSPWRVPTKDDFLELVLVLDGEETERFKNTAVRNRLLNDWGGNYTGFIHPALGVTMQNSNGFYWTQSDTNHTLFFCTGGWIDREAYADGYEHSIGAAVRCVRDAAPTSVNTILPEKEKTIVGYFNMLGQKLPEEPTSGLFIILYNNGKVEKIVK